MIMMPGLILLEVKYGLQSDVMSLSLFFRDANNCI